MGKLTTLRHLQQHLGLDVGQSAQLLLVSPETYRRWISDRLPNPTAVRLMAILAGYVPWPGWDGWEMHRGLLFPPGYTKHGIAPADWQATTYLHQLVAAYRDRIADLERQLMGANHVSSSRAARPDRRSVRSGRRRSRQSCLLSS